jgi:hypothetical protein
MPKADSSTTPIRSRRAVLAGMASAGALPIVAAIPTAAAPAMPAGSERAGAFARMEQIVELLRTCYVREGWKIDDEAAERALAFARQYAKDGSETDEGHQAAIDFVGSHGQSLDWVFCGDVGGMVCRLAKHSERAAKVAGKVRS